MVRNLARSLRRLKPQRFSLSLPRRHDADLDFVDLAPPPGPAALNDATIYLHAPERAYTVLTRNICGFDIMNQIVPPGRMLFYRTA